MNRRACLFALALTFGSAVAAAPPRDLTVSAAASLQNAMREIGLAFQRAHPETAVHFNFGASGSLLAQLAQGAPVDVFASADPQTMDRAQASRLIDAGTRVDFAATELVLVSPRSRAASFKSLDDLQRADVRHIAIGTPASVPAGRYAKDALERSGLWPALAPKLVFAANVRQALDYVSRGEVDAAFVYRTDARVDPDTVRVDFPVAAADPVRYPLARVAGGANPRDADAFITFVTRAPGQAVLARHGFAPP
ncbi:MAG: molybdate ABC transporter substrate-binding protein [Burkholderiaceae bacterium]